MLTIPFYHKIKVFTYETYEGECGYLYLDNLSFMTLRVEKDVNSLLLNLSSKWICGVVARGLRLWYTQYDQMAWAFLGIK